MDENKKNGEFKLLKLNYPVSIKTETGEPVKLDEIKLGRLKTGMLKTIPASSYSDDGRIIMQPSVIIPLLAQMANLPEETIEQIDWTDLSMIMDELDSFFG